MYSSLFWTYLGLYFWKDLTLSGKRNCGVLLYFGCCQEAASVYFKIMYVAMFSFKKSANLFESFWLLDIFNQCFLKHLVTYLVKENNFTFLFSLNFL